jgi:hypothetical protein
MAAAVFTFPSFPSCTWERACLRNFVALTLFRAFLQAWEAKLRRQVRPQVQLGNEGKSVILSEGERSISFSN